MDKNYASQIPHKRIWPLVLGLLPCLGSANDFPTLDRVDQVLTCMRQHGGQTVDNLYACSCAIDTIASFLPYQQWLEATTFRAFKAMPGEKGGLFRESPVGSKDVKRLEQAEKEAQRRCFLGARRVEEKPR